MRRTPTQAAASRLDEGALVGYVTSGSFGHTVGKSLATALVAPEAATEDKSVGPCRRTGATGRRYPAVAAGPKRIEIAIMALARGGNGRPLSRAS